MELLHSIQPIEKDTLELSEELTMCGYFQGVGLSEMVWERYDELLANDAYWSDFVYVVVEDKEVKRIKALLCEMRLRMLKPIGSIKRLRHLLFSHVSLLFGLCSSQSSLIINAFFGNSLSRIPTL